MSIFLMTLNQKFLRLKKILSDFQSCLIAFSGGTDSAFLLKVASITLPKNKILAVTAASATYPADELRLAKLLAKEFKVRHKVIQTSEVEDKKFNCNPIRRCYFCKKELFGKLNALTKKNKLIFVLDASNLTDKTDFRPGSIAKRELGVRSPLQEAGLSKEEVRILSKRIGLSTWDKPAQACLASRVPYGTKITPELLKRIEKAERFLQSLGFCQVRLRHHGELCRIEVPAPEIKILARRREEIIDKLKKLGYNYITLDLEGYRTGSMNEVMRK